MLTYNRPQGEVVGHQESGEPIIRMPKGWVPPGFVAPKSKTHNQIATVKRDGLGDKIEKLLKAIGITQERYKEVKKKLHFAPTCGCPARKYFLNHLIPRLTLAFATGGTKKAWQALLDLIEETNQKFPKEEN